MEEYDEIDKTWWMAADFMYKHLLSTGQSWSHVQKFHFVQNLSKLLNSVERNAMVPKLKTDSSDIREMIIKLRDKAHSQGMRSESLRYEDRVMEEQHKLFDALGIEY